MPESNSSSFTQFVGKQQAIWRQSGFPSMQLVDEQSGACIEQRLSADTARWNYVKRTPADFSDIETALETKLHSSIKDFYGLFYGGHWTGYFRSLSVQLVGVWDNDDFDIFAKNMISHILMQRRLKQKDSVFVASTNDDMVVVSIDNESGELILERLGQGRLKLLAPNLDQFLQQLKA
ncbi:SecY-interacting protein Syd [Alginatibacterium sediminis]|uniref:SecY-interacting protein Syd n=1 Tax=Alginatibacterium sediminis TaxID=2164068 RepID=A0A420EBP4_9ALTE|nr:SecY-interacting protein Syd [Alginatibacterium sediminis]RKF18109.1 SecY-interacting protein Syd [Alginatibacterium sediminis]